MTEQVKIDIGDIDKNLDIVYGEYTDLSQIRQFVSGIKSADCTGTLYIGYPVLSIDDGKIEFDALLVSPDKGIVIFDLYTAGDKPSPETAAISAHAIDRQEKLYAALFNRLNSFGELRKGRSLVVELTTVSINPLTDLIKNQEVYFETSIETFGAFYQNLPTASISDAQEKHLNAAIQRISNLKPQKKRNNISRPDSRGAAIKRIEEQIANLDLWQKRGSIEYVNGPQRIRGLAGSGKTVVLALKAAYLHVKRPDWDIAITFNSRSLYQQFESLLNRFVFSQINDEPDWTKLHIMHSWGDSSKPGIYSTSAHKSGAPYRDFMTAARKWSYTSAFKGACEETLSFAEDKNIETFDMILIDEAQDLPIPFFRLIYKLAKGPKRIIWAYDDLQNLGDVHLPSPRELFGLGIDNQPLVSLQNKDDHPQEDIVLPRCYRTPPQSLVVAHSLGFGIYKDNLVQMFPKPKIWERLGYKVKKGTLEYSKRVELARDPESIPEFFGRLLNPDDIIQFRKFDSSSEQYEWIALEIKRLIEQEDLQCSDFLIVIPNVYHSKSISARMLGALQNQGLAGRIPGINSSRDSLFSEEMIAITHIYRAKGNEAPVVFVVDSEFCANDYEPKSKRNILFTAITRSRAWAYVCGTGDSFQKLQDEFNMVVKKGYLLDFTYPSEGDIASLSSAEDSQSLIPEPQDQYNNARDVLEKIKDTPWEQIPIDIQDAIRNLGSQ